MIRVAGKLAVCAGTEESVAVRVNVEEPAVLGMPLIVPVAGASVSPAGNVPDVMLHVIGNVPPDAVGMYI